MGYFLFVVFSVLAMILVTGWAMYKCGQRNASLFTDQCMAGLGALPLHVKFEVLGREEGNPQILRVGLAGKYSGGTLVSSNRFDVQPKDGEIFQVIKTSLGERQIRICEPEAENTDEEWLPSPIYKQ